MTLAPFELHRPREIAEASELLELHGDDAALYCGGTELVLLLKLGLSDRTHLIDVKRIGALRGIREQDGSLIVGAAVTHREIERSPLVRDRFPALAAMERQVANIRVRTTGTLGGNLSFSDPRSDPATFMLALDAEVECQGRRPARSLPIREFLVGPYQTALAQDELLTSVRVPIPGPETVVIHRKFAPHELPTATVTVRARVAGRAIAEAAIAVGSVGPVPIRAAAAEARLVGVSTSDVTAFAEAGALAATAAGATQDANGSPAYKTHVVAVLVERALRAALGLDERPDA